MPVISINYVYDCCRYVREDSQIDFATGKVFARLGGGGGRYTRMLLKF